MARIAFFLDTRRIRSADLRDVEAGNPGIGGTEYMFFLVATHLARTHQVSMYVTAAGNHPPGIRRVVVQDLRDAAAAIRSAGEEIVILRDSEVLPNLALLRSMQQSVLVWAHNYSSRRTLRACARLPGVARYLCVSREQHERLRDEDVFQKSDYIFNAVVARTCPGEPQPPMQDNVFYMGSLVRRKGFHVLARYWGDIVEAVPTARLHVVGSRRLYDERAALGPLGLASPRYERRIARYVTEHGRLRDDIVFHGILGADKWRLLRQAKVAVTNPTGAGETFCISAAEFGLLGVPVVTRNAGGPIDVVENGVSGILFDDERELPAAVIGLLRDESRRAAMGRQAMVRIRSRFDIEVVIEKWHQTIADVLAGTRVAGDGRVTLPGADGNRRAAGDGLISASSLPGRSQMPARPCAIVITQRLLDWCTGPSQGTVATGAIRWFRDPDPLGPRLKNRPFPERLRFALAGIAYALRAESSFRTHALAAAVALAALVWLRPAPVWWALVALTTVAVLAAELFNTALEQLADRLHPEQHPQIRVAKDCGAAAVLVLSVGAVVVAAALLLDVFGG